MYFYEIEVYYPFYESEKIIMGHDAYFDNHQLNVIVQEAFDEKEENTKDDFNISVLKQYFIYFKNSIEKIEIAIIALDDFFDSYDFNDCWIDHDIKVGSEHEGDIFCGFDLDTDMKRGKKLLEKYGVILEDTEDGFWITGVKE